MTDRTPRNRWLRALALAATAGAATAVACVTPSPNRVLGPDGNLPVAREAPPPVVMAANQTFFEFQVEEPVRPLNNVRAIYPAELQARGVTGRVIAQFVVGPDSTAEVSTFKVLESDDDQFSAAVRAALPDMRFIPAKVGGRAVKQLVQQPFVFGAASARTRVDTATVRAGVAAPAVLAPSNTPRPGPGAGGTQPGFRTEEPATPLNNAMPTYPVELRGAGRTGEVIAQFVVDTAGMAEPSTFRVLESDHSLFTAAVREALPRMRFSPAKVDGRKVKQLMTQSFDFNIR